MVFTKEYKFPSDEELKVEECPLGSPYIRAGAHHLGKYCEAQNNEFMLCRHETRDPIKCLPEGKVVTSCTNEFFRKVSVPTLGQKSTFYPKIHIVKIPIFPKITFLRSQFSQNAPF